ncbi:carboxylesterase family protein [Humibacter ginsengiterrae]|jgi:para-nitrobenzyl esterase
MTDQLTDMAKAGADGSAGPVVQTRAGAVRGVRRGGSAAFLGIPFAKPPVGELRFAAPVPHEGWDGIRDATQYGATPQRKALAEITLIPEPSIPGDSTLNVNVFTPAPGDTEAALPVLVYIHGGGFVAGSPASPWYDGAAFNRDGVVTVSVSYRLGFEGFGWVEDAPLNRGMLDWMLALEWVRDNIRSFGGDPGKVTIAGQSAGGASVFALLASPKAAHLFRSAISLSGPVADSSLEAAEANARRLAKAAGVEPTVAGFSSLDETRVLQLQNEADPIAGSGGTSADPLAGVGRLATRAMPWCPVVDGDLLPTHVAQGIASRAAAGKPLLLGTTDQEFNMGVASLGELLAGVDAREALQRAGLSGDEADAYASAHPGEPAVAVLGQFVTDALFRAPTRRVGDARARADAPTWLFRFSWQSPTMAGAVHCLDVPFFFDCLGAERVDVIAGTTPPQALADEVHAAAVSFIATGDPGWAEYRLPERAVMAYCTPSRVVQDGFGDAMAVPGPSSDSAG